jgi:hypothetical protein
LPLREEYGISESDSSFTSFNREEEKRFCETRPTVVAARQKRPHHEGPSPRSSLVSTHTEDGATSPALLHFQPAIGKAKGRAMVLRCNRPRRVLLRTGDDDAPGARTAVESRNFLPWRSNHGPAEGLDSLDLGLLSGRSDREPQTGSRREVRPISLSTM